MKNQIELNGKVFRKAVVTATGSKWHESEVLVILYKNISFVTVLCEDGSTVIMNVKNVSYL